MKKKVIIWDLQGKIKDWHTKITSLRVALVMQLSRIRFPRPKLNTISLLTHACT